MLNRTEPPRRTKAITLDGLSDCARAVLNRPQDHVDEPHVLADTFLLLKVRQGCPVTSDRLQRLKPRHHIYIHRQPRIDREVIADAKRAAAASKAPLPATDRPITIGTVAQHMDNAMEKTRAYIAKRRPTEEPGGAA